MSPMPDRELPLRSSRSPHLARFALTILAAMLAACQAASVAGTLPPTPGAASTSPASPPTELPSSTSTATEIPHLILGVAPEQAELAAAALAEFSSGHPEWVIQLNPSEPGAEQLERGEIDLALLPDDAGLPVADRPLALAVPFDRDWADLSLEQAQELLKQGTDFVAAIEWPDMVPDLRALRVDGIHPGEAGYPLRRIWSLHARPGLEEVARALAPFLAAGMTDDHAAHLAAVGDVMLDRTFRVMLTAGELDFPFRRLGLQLRQADLTIGNLESALGTGGRPESKGYTFRAPLEAAQSLALAGFDLMSLANNHAMDFGPTVLLQAIQLLHDQGIDTVGAGADEAAAHHAVLREVGGLQLAFLAYVDVPQEYRGFDARAWQASGTNPGVAWADVDRIRSDVAAAGQMADLVIVVLHSGYEYVPTPSPEQTAAAHAAIESGADLVLGHHAHLLQGVELYQGGVIAYGLGNFAFEDAGPPESGILQIWLDDDGVRAFDLVPVTLDEFGRPGPAEGEAAAAIRQVFLERTRALTGLP
jgi:hypothetical protein